MTCTNVRRMHGKVETPAKPRNGRIVIGVLLAVLLVCVAVGVALHLRNVEIEQQTQVQLRDDFVAELERNEGTYDAQSIVLYNTSRAKAEELAEQLGASLRMTKDGSFATLTLPEGTTILDVCRNEENLAYIEQMSADYQVSISELIEGEEDEEGDDERLPMRPTYTVSDTDYDKQTYLDYMNMQNVWASYTGYGVTIAVIDTGIDTDHPEFAGRISEYSYNATEDKIVKDYVLENGEYDWSLVEDEQGHGTAVTGVIAASMNSGNVVGIAPNVTIITIKAECDEDGNFQRASDLVFGLYYAIERDVSVVNMSFGGGNDVFGAATRLAYDSDVICVAAAGNDSTAGLTYPAADPLVIGVGALADGSWELAEYSNYGENVNVVAPGTTYTSLMGGGYGYMDGTSLACPAVTGLIALYMQTHKYVMFDQVAEELYASCYDLGDLGCDWYFGFGAVDANAFLIEERGTVTFDMLTDEVDDIEGTFIRGHALQELPEPDRLYAIFDGWYYDEQCTQRVEYYADAFYGDITLYASWVNEDDGIPFTYRILDDGTIEILSYIGHRRFITVPEKIEGRIVSSIGDFAFAGETNLREVGLPSGLRHIGLSAFAGCSNLVSMYIPENVTVIEAGAFAECVRLSTIAFTGQSKLLTIGNKAFFACGKLRTLELPASLQSINGKAFIGTSALTSIRVQNGNQYFKSEDGVLFDISGEMLVAYPAAHGTTYEIPSGVATVGDYAFYGAKVIFLNLGSIQTIGESAFSKSSVLTVNIPDSVTKMGDDAFNTSAVRELTIGAGLTEIAEGAFAQCGSLRSVYIPEGIITIHRAAFYATGLQSVTFAENSQLYVIDDKAFACCDLTEIEIPASVEYIGSADGKIHDPEYYSPDNPVGAFDLNIGLTKVIFAENSQIKTIGNRAFAFCSIGCIDMPEGLECLGAGAFWGTSLETVVLPASLTELCEAALGNSSLLDITVSEGNAVYHSVDGVVYNLDHTEVYAYPAGRGGEYTVIETTRSIKPYSFAGSWYLEKVTLPEGLTEVGTYGFCYSGALTYDMPSTLVYIRKGAFYGNYSLSQLSLPDSLEQIAEYAFYVCVSLPTVHMPDNVLQIGRYSFSLCWSLASVTFNETAKLPRISYGAFAYCGLETFRVPANVSTMAQGAFKGCYKLTSFTFAENSKLESISAYMFDGCSNLRTITFEQGSALTSVQAHGLEGMNKLTTINWGDAKVTNIDNFAFRFCESLADPALPDTVINVGRYAFYGCKSLSELTLPAQVEHIGMFAFLGTKDLNLYLTADTMPAYLDEDWDHGIRGYYVGVTNVVTDGDYKYATLTSGDVSIIEYLGSETEIDLSVLDFGAPITGIGGSAFEDKGITRVTLPDTLTSVQAEAFAYNPLEEITIPAGVTFIGREAFTYTEIASLTFAEGSQIKTIEQYAFEKTENLTEVTLPASLTTMGRGVFQQSGLTSVTFEEGIALERIPQNAFTETNLTSIALPDSVNYIDHNAFREISTLQSVTFGNAESISLQSNSFYHTGLTSLHIPANVTYIGEYSFVALANLTEITVDENNPWYKSEDGLLLSKDGRKLIVVPAGRTGSLTVPTSVEMLGFGAFEESKLSEVKFDPNANILTLGYRAFFKANNITSIDIPKSVISIDYYAFAYCENLQTVNFAEDNQLKGIYEGAFLGDINLENITIPDTIVEISDFAFYGCSKIDRIPISENGIVKGIYSYAFAYTGISGEFTTPETLIDIGDYAFMGTKITKLTVPDTKQWDLIIGIGAFEDCYKLEEVTLPFIGASLDDMQYSWFGYIFGAGAYEANAVYVPASLKTVTITEGQTLVGIGGFAYLTSVETINLPHSICALYNDAFVETTAQYELTNTIMTWYKIGSFLYPWATQGHFGTGFTGHLELAGPGVIGNNTWTDGVTEISSEAFRGCTGLTSVTIPNSVTSIDFQAFAETGLTSVTIPDSVTKIEQQAFRGSAELLSITIGNGVTSIGANAFAYCTSLSSIYIPDGVTTLGSMAFEGCTSLTSARIPDSVSNIGYDTFANCINLTSVTIGNGVESISNYAFYNCNRLTSVTIPDSVTSIGSSAFQYCTGLTSVVIGNSVSSIGEYAFNGCTDLATLTMGDSVTNIGNYAFEDCQSLTSITMPDSVTSIGYGVFHRCASLKTITIPDSVTTIESGTFVDCTALTSATIGSGVTRVSDGMFQGCTGLTSVTIPDSVTSIGGGAFRYCTSLTSITIPDSVTSIGGQAFEDCTSLMNVAIPDSVTSIGSSAFYNCTSLICADIPDGVTQIGEFTFYDCSSLTNATIPDGVTSIDAYAFRGCSSLSNISIPNSVISIGDFAFAYCDGLSSVTIPDSVTSIGICAFDSCRGLSRVTIGSGVTNIDISAFNGCTRLYYVVNHSALSFTPGDEGNGEVSYYAKIIEQGSLLLTPSDAEYILDEQGFLYSIANGDYILYAYIGEADSITLPSDINGNAYQIQAFSTCANQITIPNGISRIDEGMFDNCANLTSIILPNSVTNIGDSAFYRCTGLVSITLPDSVTSIGDSVFYDCKNLLSIMIPDSVTYIGPDSFAFCTRLSSVIIPDSVTSIEKCAFFACSSLSSVIIPNSVTSIGESAFYGCTGLTSITIPDSVTSIGAFAFESCGGLTSIIIPNSVTSIGSSAFKNCRGLTSIIIPDSVTSIDGDTFQYCSNLTSVTIGNSVTRIGGGAFQYCTSLFSITIPDNVTNIGYNAFNGCTSLTIITISSGTIVARDAIPSTTTILWTRGQVSGIEIDGILYDEEMTCIIQVLDKSIVNANIPDGVKYIPDNAFENCASLTSVTIPDSVTSIGSSAFSYCTGLTSITIPNSVTRIGSNAFSNCTGLTSVTIPESVKILEYGVFNYCTGLTSISFPNSVTSVSLYGCTALTDITLPNNVVDVVLSNCTELTSIALPDSVTYVTISECPNLTSLIIPNSVSRISNQAFYGCTGLTNITIPDGVTSIGSGAFSGCTGLTSITIPDGVTSIDNFAFSSCTGLTSITIPDSVTSIGDYAFADCRGLTSITISNSVTSIGDSTFYGCTGLTSIAIPNSVTCIEEYAFRNCTGLISIEIPNSVTSIGYLSFGMCTGLQYVSIGDGVLELDGYEFYQCTSLKAYEVSPDNPNYEAIDGILYDKRTGSILNIPANLQGEVTLANTVTSIGENAFRNCPGLTSVNIPNSVTSIGESAFYGCTGLTSITIPDSVTSIDDYVFYGCTSLKNITISGSVTSIGSCAFELCTGLVNITIPDSVTSIGYSAFNGCSSLTSIVIPGNVVTIDSGTFADCSSLTSVTIPNSVTSIGGCAFQNCTGLTSIAIPNSVESIGDFAFRGCTGLQSITIPDRVVSIDYGVFKDCSGLTSVVIGDGVTSIGYEAFYGCYRMTRLTVGANVTNIGNQAFSGCDSLYYVVNHSQLDLIPGTYNHGSVAGDAKVVVDRNGTSISRDEAKYFLDDQGFLYGVSEGVYVLCAYMGELDSITLPESLEGNQYNIQGFRTNAKHVIIPYGTVQISYSAFNNCVNLVSITIPDSVTTIGATAFAYCTSLTSITIPDSVNYIGYRAFIGCKSLTSITIPDGVTSINSQTFLSCSNLTSIVLSNRLTNISGEAFNGCSSLTSITIPDSVNSIEAYAFLDCTNLTNIVLSDNLTNLGEGAFDNTGYYNNPDNFKHGILALNGWILAVDPTTKHLDFSMYCGAAYYAYEGGYLLKNAIWNSSLGDATNVETLVVKDIAHTIALNHPQYPSARLPITVQRIVITKDVDLAELRANLNFFQYVSGVVIYVEGNEKDLRWDDNFPGWNNGNRVIYGDKWTWATFYDEQGNIILQEPRLNEKIIRKPIVETKEDAINIYEHMGWDINGDGLVDSLPATTTTDLFARPIYSVIPQEYSVVFKDSETGEYYKQETLHYGDLITLPETPVREDGYLIGWSGYAEGMTVIGHVEFLTQWHVHQYSAIVIAPTCTEKGYTTYYCHCGDTYLDRYVDSLGHDMVDWYQTAAPTCTTEGENRRDCGRDCGYYETEVVLANGHSHADAVEKNHLNPTCTEIGGYDMVVYCAVCGVELSREHHDIDALGHNMSSWYQIVTPTCTTEGENRRDCGRGCGYYETEVISANGHTPADVVEENRFAPTCTDIGGYDLAVYCAVCSVELSREHIEVPANGHTPADAVEENRFAPTCTEIGGYDMVVYCTVCGVELSRDHYDVVALGHDVGEWYQTVAPTCTTEGENRRDCSRCDYFDTEVVPANGHTPADAVEENRFAPTCTDIGGYDLAVYCTVCSIELSREHIEVPADGHTHANAVEENRFAPTCTEIGGYDMAVYCTVCGVELSRDHYEIDALGHDMGEWYQTVAPTCTTEGENRRDCSRCDYFETEVVSANGHTEADAVEENRVEPTCTEIGGYDMVVYCTVCDAELSREHTVLDALGHAPADAVEENHVDPTCTEIGGYDMVVYCTVCDAELSREHTVLEALGHAPATEWTEDLAPTCTAVGSKSHHCTRCDEKLDITEIPANGHSHTATVTAPTCIGKGFTSYYCHCTDFYIGDYVDALGHTEAIDEAVAPTCTATGLTEGKHCSVCNAVLVAQEVVPANGHTYESVVTAPTCTEKGYTTHTCHCGDSYVDSEVDALGHTPSDWVVDAEAQIGVEGSKHKECTVCGETLETEAIEALTEAPTTEPEPSGGCNGTISASVVLLALLSCFAVAWRPRKDN